MMSRTKGGILLLSGWAAVIGLIAGIMTALFLTFADVCVTFLNQDVPDWMGGGLGWIFPLVLIMVCGLAVGLILKRYGENTGLGRAQKEFDEEGGIGPGHLADVMGSSFLSIISGASVGPEGALVDLHGRFGTFLGSRLKVSAEDVKILVFAAIAGCFGGYFGSPVVGVVVSLEYMFIKKLDYYRLIVPALVSAAVGYAVYYLLLGTSLVGVFTFPNYDTPRLIDLALAVPLALVGAALGLAQMVLMMRTSKTLERVRGRPVKRALIGAAAIGVIGLALPLTLYSGQTSMEELLKSFSEKGIVLLLLLVLAKMVAMSISFGSGFKGGPIFPLLFMGGTMGMAMSLMFPWIPVGVCILVLMSSFICVIWPIPLSVALFLGIATQPALVPVIVIGAVVGYIVSQEAKARMEEKNRKTAPGEI